jgi:hypothetical protein
MHARDQGPLRTGKLIAIATNKPAKPLIDINKARVC